MTISKRVRSFCLAVVCLTSVFAFGVAGSASANILFLPLNNTFPYHLTGLTIEKGTLETVDKQEVTATGAHVLVLVLNKTLFHVHILFLGVKGAGVAPCSNLGGAPSSGVVLIELLGHLGLAHTGLSSPVSLPGVLLLVPNGFSFICELLGVKEKISVLGSVIGLITHPKPNIDTRLLGIKFSQEKGVQQHTLFLLSPSGEVMTDQLLDSAINGGAYLQAGEATPEILLHALEGEPLFALVLDPPEK